MAVTQAPRIRSDAVPLRTYRSQGRPAAIAGIGVHVPDRVLTNQELEQMVDTSDQWITERTGIKERRVAEPGTPTFELATVITKSVSSVGGISPSSRSQVTAGVSIWLIPPIDSRMPVIQLVRLASPSVNTVIPAER